MNELRYQHVILEKTPKVKQDTMKYIILILGISFSFVGCKKYDPPPPEYVGTWNAKTVNDFYLATFYTLKIKSNGEGEYKEDAPLFDTDKKGGVEVTASTLSVGSIVWNITQPPTESDGTWTMGLDSVMYER